MRRLVSLAVCTFLLACPRQVREEPRERQLEAGVPTEFTGTGKRTWKFGDGTPPVDAETCAHAFARPGTYFVKAFDGDSLTDTATVIVRARSPLSAIPRGATRAVVFRAFSDAMALVDFLEHLGPANPLDDLSELPLLALAVESPGAPFASNEGVGVFTLAGDLTVSFIGEEDDAAALARFDQWLADHGWQSVGAGAFARDETEIVRFTDRGTLYVVTGTNAQAAAAAELISTAGPLAALPELKQDAERLPGVFALSIPHAQDVKLAVAGLSFNGATLELHGTLHAAGPLWTEPDAERPKLLEHAPAGAVAAASLSIPGPRLRLLLNALGLTESSSDAHEFDRLGTAFRGTAEVLALFDPQAVLADLTAGRKPGPRGVLLGEFALNPGKATQDYVDQLLDQNDFAHDPKSGGTSKRYEGYWQGRPSYAVVTPQQLAVSLGALEVPPAENLRKRLQQQFPEAFGPTHLSIFIDAAAAIRQLKEARIPQNADPRKALAAQAMATLFAEQLIPISSFFFDAAPSKTGATITAQLVMRPRREPQ